MQLRTESIHARGASTTLIIILHGWTQAPSAVADIVATVEETFPDADLFIPTYPAAWHSGANPTALAEELADLIDSIEERKRKEGHPYQGIILIGHSLGALLVRKAWVFACGESQDCRIPLRAEQPWASLVKKIVLLAGMNRGWSFEERPANMGFARYTFLRLGAWGWRWLRFPALINHVRRGSPFIVNLRIQWLNLVRSRRSMPLVVQLLGTIDDVVTANDHMDLQCGGTFKYLRVLGAGHADIVSFTNDERGSRCRRRFLDALLNSPETLKSDHSIPVVQDENIESVVFVIHGIRDYGDWTQHASEIIELLAAFRGQRVLTFHPSYGYFNMLDFLIQPERKDRLRWFMDEYTQKLARFPKASINFVGHSNGTYLLGAALRDYSACRFDRVVLTGSVLNRHFDWSSLLQAGRVKQVLNYVATRDWIVAVLPGVFEQISRRSELGSAGHSGFTSHGVALSEIRFIEGGHGAALVPENYANIAIFILCGDPPDPELPIHTRTRPAWVTTLGQFAIMCWIAIIVLAGSVALLPAVLTRIFFGSGSSVAARSSYILIPAGIVMLRYILKRA